MEFRHNNGTSGAPSPHVKVMDSPFVSFMPFKPFASSSPVAFKFNNENAGVQQQQGASPRRSPRFIKRDAAAAPAAASSSSTGGNVTLDISGRLLAAAPSPAATTITSSAASSSLGKPSGKQKTSDLQQLAALIKRIKKPTAPSNVFVPAPAITHREQTGEEPDSKAFAAPDWEALPVGTVLSVWWEGSGESFECVIRDWHVAVGEGGRLFYTHRCEYESGTFDHDLSTQSFEVVSLPDAAASEANLQRPNRTPTAAAKAAAPAALDDLTPKRRWLAKQEAELSAFSEELENADIATPVSSRADALRGRLFLRRVSQPNVANLTPRQLTPRAADGSIKIVDPSDRAITYRMPFGIATTPRSAVVRTPRNFSSKKAAAAAARVKEEISLV